MNGSHPPVKPLTAALTALLMGGVLGALTALLRAQLLLAVVVTPQAKQEAPMLQARLAREFSIDLLVALALCGAAGLSSWFLLRGKRAHWWLAVPLAGVAAWFSVVGGPWSPGAQRLAAASHDELLATPVLALISLLAALALCGLVRAAQFGAPIRRKAYTSSVVLVLVGLALLPTAYRESQRGEAPEMTIRLVQREVALDEASWRVKLKHPRLAPKLGILTPLIDYRTDGGDLPAIIMPPPAVVEFEVTEADGEVHLDFAAGVDDSVNRSHRGAKPLRVGFEVAVNGKRVFMNIIDCYKDKPFKKIKWQRPKPDAPQLDLKPGDVVTLRTAIVGQSDEKTCSKKPVLAGFGNVVLERRETRKRLPSSPDKPNIILIVQDTMRADHSSLHGYEKSTTPALDALAERGITFREARSTSSWTWPSTASILTGLLPDEHGVTDDSACYLLGKNETLAEALQARGYTTAAYACNPLISAQKNFDQGFESFSSSGKAFLKTSDLIEEIRSWIRLQAGTRFFLYLHLVDPHAPYEPRPESLAAVGEPVPEDFPGQRALEQYKKAALGGLGFDQHGERKPSSPFPEGHIEQFEGLYDASILTGDYFLGAIVEELEESDLVDETVIVFTSDHGEEWMDHGYLLHGQSVHRELVHVPLVMAGPGLARGAVSETPVSNRHIAATLARIGGAELAGPSDAIDLTSPELLPERAVFYATTHGRWNGRRGRQPIYGVRDGQWVLHFAPKGSDFGVAARKAPVEGQCKLYNVEQDPAEQLDVSAQHPQVTERLRTLILDSLSQQLARQQGSVKLGGGAATMKMLDGIGYLDD